MYCYQTVTTFSMMFMVIRSGGGGGNSKKVNTHPKIPEIDLDFFRVAPPPPPPPSGSGTRINCTSKDTMFRFLQSYSRRSRLKRTQTISSIWELHTQQVSRFTFIYLIAHYLLNIPLFSFHFSSLKDLLGGRCVSVDS